MTTTDYEKELEKARRSGDPETIANALNQLAYRTDHRHAIECYREAAVLYKAAGLSVEAGAQWIYAAEIYELHFDDKIRALRCYDNAIKVLEKEHSDHGAYKEARNRAFSLRIRLGWI